MRQSKPKPNPLTQAQLDAIEAAVATLPLDAKIGQLFQTDWRSFRAPSPCCASILPNWNLTANNAPVRSALTDRCVGSVLGGGGARPTPNTSRSWRMQHAAMQRAAQASVAGIQLLVGNDSVHGQSNLEGATLFPHHIGQGCMRDERGQPDEALVEALAAVAARESAACGCNWVFSPCVAVPHDLRWGRTYEGFGEDASLVGVLGAAEVRGLQESGVPVAACLKHWVADGGTAFGTGSAAFAWTGAPVHVLDQGDAKVSDAELQAHVAAYLPGLATGCLTVMVSYSSIHGLPCHASRKLITEVLKEQLGFDGLVVSDYDAVPMLRSPVQGQPKACAVDLVDAIAVRSPRTMSAVPAPARAPSHMRYPCRHQQRTLFRHWRCRCRSMQVST